MLARRTILIPAIALFGIGIGAAPALADTGTVPSDDIMSSPSDMDVLDEIGSEIRASAYEADPDIAPFVDDEELSNQRGGFAIGGLDIALGADIKTFINDQLALHTVVNWSDHAVSQTQVMSGALTMVDASNLRDQILSSGNIRMQIGSSPVFTANEGQTAISHRTDGALQNILINTASYVNVRQEVNATLDVAGYSEFAAGIQNVQMSNLFGESINNAIASFGG